MSQTLLSVPRPTRGVASTALPLRMLSQLFDAALDAVVVMDGSGLVTAWNRSATATFGWTADEAVGRRLSELIIPEGLRDDHERGLRRVQVGRRRSRVLDRRLLMTAVHRDGHEIPVELTVTRLGAAGEPLFAGFVRDLSREAASEAARTEAETRYRSLVERLPGIAYVSELGGEARFVSPRLEEILGYAAEEWTFDMWSSLIHPRERESVLAALESGQSSGQPFTLTYRIRSRNGRWISIRDEALVITDPEGGRTIHGVMFDITRERSVELALRASLREREQVAASLHRLQARATAEETAAAVCSEVARTRYLDMAVIFTFESDGSVMPLGAELPPGGPLVIGHPVAAARAAYLRESATGPWVDELANDPIDDDYRRRWREVGLSAAAYVPFGAGGEVHGLLAAGTTARTAAELVTRWVPSLAEYAAVAGALLVPSLTRRRAHADVVSPIRRAIEQAAFTPYFQEVVELESRSVVGYEALTRFADGVLPERRFADADLVGLGADLELACLKAAVSAARDLPQGRWLSLNLSPSLVQHLDDSHALGGHNGRPVVLELTERSEISDYAEVRSALARLPGPLSLAVDDAGAGFASFRHIIELHPRYVKLDMRLVRGVDEDAARQALIAGMVYFSRQTDCVLIAEGIETEGERRTLRQLGVTFGQGYLFGHPRRIEELSLGNR
jgi:PAS domain S-box-containing protein